MYFEPGPGISTRNIIKAIHNPTERVKWDKDVEFGKFLEVVCSGKALVFHQQMKSAIALIKKRDFLEKKIKFSQTIESPSETNTSPD